jgi:hypothetical protein
MQVTMEWKMQSSSTELPQAEGGVVVSHHPTAALRP